MRLAQLNTPLKITERGEVLVGYIRQTANDTADLPVSVANSRKDWTAKQVEAARSQITSEFARRSEQEGFSEALTWIKQLVDSQTIAVSKHANLMIFCAALTLLELDLIHDFLSESERKRLLELGSAILKLQGIDPESRLGFLLGDIRQAKALDATRRGQTWSAFFEQMLSWQAGRRSNHVRLHGTATMNTALRALRLGNTGLAIEGLTLAEEQGLDPASQLLARVARVQALRLRGDLASAQALIDDTRRVLSINHEAELELTWEEAIIKAIAQGGDAWRDLFNLCRRGRPHYEATYLLEAHLWAYAAPSLKYLSILPKLSTIKANARGSVTRNIRFSLLISVVSCLETLYEPGLPSEIKLSALAEVSENLNRFPGIDRELLAKLAFARWAQRNNLGIICALLLGEYHAMCQRLTGGNSNDVLELSPSQSTTPWERLTAGSAGIDEAMLMDKWPRTG